MTIQTDIMKSLSRSLDFTSTVSDLTERLDLNPSSVRSSLSRLTKKGILKRIKRGTYKIEKLFRKFRHTKRIIETSTKNPLNKFDLDVETTSEGFVPSWLKISDIESVLNPKLIDETLKILTENGVFLFEEKVTFSIMGSEWLDEIDAKYNPFHTVEIVLVSQQASRYVFDGSYIVRLKDYD